LGKSHIKQVSQNTNINVAAVRRLKYLHDFDREVQGPTWGYPTEGAYYRDASSSDSLLAIRIPFLALHAEDDPVSHYGLPSPTKSMADFLQIAVNEALPRNEVKQTPYGVLCTTALGGHLSWFELGGGRWFSKAVSTPDPWHRLWSRLYSAKTTAFLQKMACEIDLDQVPESDDTFEGEIVRSKREPLKPVFDPMRRKLHLPTST
jgi:predicted alpha/beta-fold hydrolase